MSLGRYTGVLLGLVGFCIYLAVKEDVFLTWSNWENIFRSNAVVFILALGMTFVVITAGIDLSVASMTVLAGMVFGLALDNGAAWGLALMAALGIGLAMGLVNGFLIGVARISFFVVTLGTLSIYQSVALLSTKGDTLALYENASFSTTSTLVNGSVGPIPYILILYSALYLVAAYVLRYSRFGRSVYAIGSNPEAARLTGINVTAVLVAVYALCGVCAGLAGMVQTGRLGAAAPQVDPTQMLTVVAAVLIGGTAYTGGVGGLLGTALGVLFLGVVQNGLALTGVSAFWQGTVSGVILIVAIGLGVFRDHGWGGGLRVLRRFGRREPPQPTPEKPASTGSEHAQ
jgi:ribose transport system permease protein